jgi:hypothetical protein
VTKSSFLHSYVRSQPKTNASSGVPREQCLESGSQFFALLRRESFDAGCILLQRRSHSGDRLLDGSDRREALLVLANHLADLFERLIA